MAYAEEDEQTEAPRPSRFVGFDRYFDANAGAAKSDADKVQQRVQGTVDQLQGQVDQDVREQDAQVRAGVDVTTGEYKGPREYSPSDRLAEHYDAAKRQTKNLSSPDALQAQMGQGANWFSAGLASRAGAHGFDTLKQHFAALDKRMAGLPGEFDAKVAAAEKDAQDWYRGIQAHNEKAARELEELKKTDYREYLRQMALARGDKNPHIVRA